MTIIEPSVPEHFNPNSEKQFLKMDPVPAPGPTKIGK